MTVTLEEFTKNFTPEERAKVAARAAELIEEELKLRDLREAQQLTAGVTARSGPKNAGRRDLRSRRSTGPDRSESGG